MDYEIIERTLPDEMTFYPLLADYDFAAGRPRGGSACLDFFALGKLDELAAAVPGGLVCIAKTGLDPEEGFFLVDFAQARENPAELIKNIIGMKIHRLYVENSLRHPLDEVLGAIAGIELVLVNF